MLRLPKRFFDDHADRDLPTPVVTRETKAHYFVAPDDPHLAELKSDAAHYADGVDACDIGLVSSARAILRALS